MRLPVFRCHVKVPFEATFCVPVPGLYEVWPGKRTYGVTSLPAKPVDVPFTRTCRGSVELRDPEMRMDADDFGITMLLGEENSLQPTELRARTRNT